MESFETDPMAALWRFCHVTGFDICGQAFGDSDERLAVLQALLQPVGPETITDCLRRFQEHMGPTSPIGACAACGVMVLAEWDWNQHQRNTNGEAPLTTIKERQLGHPRLNLLQLSLDQLQAHLHIPLQDRLS